MTTGGPLAYSIQVTNAGPDAATNVVVTDDLPTGVKFISAATTQGTCAIAAKGSNQTVTCSLGTLPSTVGTPANLTPVTVTIRVLAPTTAGTITNTASVSSGTGDPNKKNDSASASTQVIAGSGPTCNGHPVTVLGTAGGDSLLGSAGVDVVLALGGNDSVVSLGSRDVVCAGGGNDRVNAGRRGDKVFGGAGADRLLGRGGGDVLRGGRGRDLLKGGNGRDLLVGGRGVDRCRGGAGRDRLRSC